MSDDAASPAGDGPASTPRAAVSGYAWYVLCVLLLVNVLNFVDRQILAIVIEDIKAEMEISDTALGFLLGFAFTLFYTLTGLPLARLADRGSRRSVIGAGIAVWSLMTIACGQAKSFGALALARFGVGIGEAAGTAPAHALISDYFPPERRATAISIHTQGVFFGVMFGFLAGGLIRDAFDWRTAFLLAGLPGIPLALLVRFTIREPERGATEHVALETETPALKDVAAHLLKRRSFVLLACGAAFQSTAGYSVISWGPAFLMRTHGMSASEVGVTFGILAGLSGGLGALLGGLIADRLGQRDVRWYLWCAAAASFLAFPLALPFYLSNDRVLALSAFAGFYMLSSVYAGPMWTLGQNLVQPRMRSVASAVLATFINLAGMGVGPLLVGFLNDTAFADYGPEAIRYSLCVMAAIALIGAIIFLFAARTLREDLVSRPGRAA